MEKNTNRNIKKRIKTEGFFERIVCIPIIGKIFLLIFDSFFFFIRRIVLLFNNKGENLIIISFHRLGDTVFTIPAIREIFKHYENYNKKILCYHESKKIYEIVFNEQISTLTKKDFMFGARLATRKGRSLLKKLKPDIIFDLTGTVTSASLIFNSTSKTIVGMNDKIFRQIYSGYTSRRTTPHLIDTYLDIAGTEFKFERTTDVYEFRTEYKRSGIILIHPFAIRNAKEWSMDKFINLAGQLNVEYKVEFVSAPNLLSSDIKEKLLKKNIPFTITKTIEDLILKIKECSVMISNDTGPIYISNLLGKPTFTIYGPTNPDYSFPFGKNHRFYRKIIDCSPLKDQFCHTLAGIYCSHHDCLNLISTNEIYTSFKSFLEELGITKCSIRK